MVWRSAALVCFAALALCRLLGQDALPSLNEPASVYGSRIWARAGKLAEELYVQALLVLPGAAQASVGTANGAGAELKLQDREGTETLHEKAKALKQELAKDEGEIDAQQKVSAQRYAELKREQDAEMQKAAEMEIPLPLEHPDEIRQKMPAIDRTGPEMRCGQSIPAESRLTTRDIELYTRAIYQGQHGQQYGWKYIVKFSNHGQETVQMLTRHWVFVDALGRLNAEVKGPGARGVTPVLPPGGEWTYESGTSLETPYGSMHGSFQFEILKSSQKLDSRSFSARVGRLAMTQNSAPQNVPCIDEAEEGLLPLTSVMSIERVILGGRADFAQKKDGKYHFDYDVQINNARDTDIEVVGHFWEVVDSNGKRHTVAEGDGVGGRFQSKIRPLAAGDAFRTQGRISSPTPEANAQGTYRVLIRGDNGLETEIETRTDYMGLSAKKEVTHVPNFVADPNFR